MENVRATDFSKLSAAQVQSLIITRTSLDINPPSLQQSIKNVHEYKERSRQYRSTVFTNKDWVKKNLGRLNLGRLIASSKTCRPCSHFHIGHHPQALDQGEDRDINRPRRVWR